MSWLKDAVNTVSDVASDAVNTVSDAASDAVNTVSDAANRVGDVINLENIGKVTKTATELWKEYTPAGIIYDKLDNMSQRYVHIANATGMPIAVIVAANKDWVYADIASAIVQLVASFGSSAPSGLQAIKQAKTLFDLYNATRYYRGIVGVAGQVYKIFAEKGITIEHGDYKAVNNRSNSNPFNYLDPSQYGAICDASDLTVMITREDGEAAIFNTNSDRSWIAYPIGYCRAEYGTIWQPEGEVYNWSENKENQETEKDSLNPGEFLTPGQFLESSNGQFQVIYQTDGNFVVYRTRDKQPLWSSNTNGKPAWRCYMQGDGNLAVYQSQGQSVWASNTDGKGNCKLIIQDDGNLVIYTSGHIPVWSTGTNGKY
jgi:hypothetical protein